MFRVEGEDCKVLNGIWRCGSLPLLLKKWRPFFGPRLGKLAVHLFWVKFPRPPLNLSSNEEVREIGSIRGSFSEADLSF
jgi:hypothetical protein